MSEQRSWAFWCARVLGHIRFKPDRKAIERELTAHYEDHRLDLERVGYEPDLAAERALRAMGDADEVGRALDRAHKPWLGWLWEVSRVLAVGLLVVTAATLLENSLFTVREMLGRTEDQFTWEAPPPTASCAVTAYGTLYLSPGDITEEDGRYEVALDLWGKTADPRTDFPWIMPYLNIVDDRGPIPLGQADEDGVWPDNYMSRGWTSVCWGWTRHHVVLSLRLDHRPQWVEVSYPYGGNDWVLRAEWEAEP